MTLSPKQIKQLNIEDCVISLKQEIYDLISTYAEAREGIDLKGNGHHYAQKTSENVAKDFEKRLNGSFLIYE